MAVGAPGGPPAADAYFGTPTGEQQTVQRLA